MTELEKAVAWLEHWKMVKECDARSYPHRTEHAEAANHCRVLLDALKENERLKADRATFLENMTVLSDALTEAEDKLDAIMTWYAKTHIRSYKACKEFLAIIKDGDKDA